MDNTKEIIDMIESAIERDSTCKIYNANGQVRRVWNEMKRLYEEEEQRAVALREEAEYYGEREDDILAEQNSEYNAMIAQSIKRNR